MKKLLAVLLVSISLLNTGYAKLMVNQRQDENGTFFDIKNKFFSTQISSLGGRIYSLKSFPSGKELLYVSPGHGGSFDDRAGRVTEQYDFEVIKNNADEFIVKFTYNDKDGLIIEKKISIFNDLPFVNVDYRLINKSESELSYQHMMRHSIAARNGNEVLNEADYIYYHDIRGIHELNWPEQWLSKTISEVKVPDPIANWQAAASSSDKVGIVYYADELSQLYFWSKAGGNGYGTLEPTMPTIIFKPNQEKNFSMLCIPYEGLDGISSATKDYLSYLKKDVHGLTLSLTTQFRSISDKFLKPQNVNIYTQILDLNRQPVTELTSDIKTSLNDAIAVATASFEFAKEGEYIIKQEIKVCDKVIGSYETPINIGLPETYVSQYYDPSYQKVREMMDFSISAEDLQNGYFITQLTDEGENVSVEQIETDLGIGEQEVVGAELFAMADIGKVNLILDKGNFQNELKLFVKKDKWLEKADSFEIKKGDRQKIYVWLNTLGLKAGKYKAVLKMQPNNSASREVALKFNVYPVEFPTERKLCVALFHANLSAIFGNLYPGLDESKWLDMWDKCLEDYQLLGSDVLDVRHLSQDRFAKATTKVIEWKDGYLPVLDISKWHPYFDMARKGGMKHIRISYNWMAGCWKPKEYDVFNKEKQEEVDLFVLKQLYDFFETKGFESCDFYFIDEISPSHVNEAVRKMKKIKSVIPEMGFGGSGLGDLSLEQIQELAHYLVWISPYLVESRVFKMIESEQVKLLPGALVATQVQADELTYAKARIQLWLIWKCKLAGIQMYGYTGHAKNYTWCSVYPGKDRPQWSIGLAGLMDGLEDYEYVRMLEDKMMYLEKEGKQVNRIKEALNNFVGNEDKNLFLWKYVTRQSFVFPEIEGNLVNLKKAKKIMLELLADTEGQNWR